MAGFFDKQEVSYGGRVKPKRKVEESFDCDDCKLYLSARNPNIKPQGRGKKGIMIVTESPSSREDSRGTMWAGTQGQLVRSVLNDAGYSLDDDCVSVYAVRCLTEPDANGDDRNPLPVEIGACRRKLFRAIEKHQPRVIISMGYYALSGLIGHLMDKGLGRGIDRWRGAQIPFHETGAWLCPVYHPIYVLANEKNPAVEKAFERDMAAALAMRNVPLPQPLNLDNVEIIKSPDEAQKFLKNIIRQKDVLAAHDWEATGLKPHAKGHKIWSMGISFDEGHAVSFKMSPDLKEPVADYLRARSVKKIAAGMKFEDMWGRAYVGTPTYNWYWDTMVAQHVVDNRRDICGLKFQAAVRFGIWDYDSEIEDYLKGEDETNANSFNRIYQAPLDKLLKYNAIDALITRMLCPLQISEIEEQGTMDGYMLMHRGLLTLGDMEWRGIPVEDSHVAQELVRLDNEIKSILDEMWRSREGKLWRQKYGRAANWNSGDQLIDILQEAGVQLEKKTKGGKLSTDKGVLETIPHPLAGTILRARKLSKNGGTFLTGIRRESVNGLLHPFFHLHKVITYRSSSDSPNFQNMPKRDEESMKIVRSSIRAPEGWVLCEIDYSGVEVRVGCCYHRDKNMERYILDPTTDMHRDEACSIFCFDPDFIMEEVVHGSDDQAKKFFKAVRNSAKNGWVFAEFYGDWYKACAKNIWNQIAHWNLKAPDGRGMFEHLRKHGIKSLSHFEEHLKECEAALWNVRFEGYKNWKERTWKKYLKQGYLDTYTGFRLNSVASRNEILNAPIQGSAFHCLLWSVAETNRILKKEKWESYLVGQIHDSMLLLARPDEVHDLYHLAKRVMCKDITREWDWLTIPLDIEMDVTPVGGTWSQQKPYNPEKEAA